MRDIENDSKAAGFFQTKTDFEGKEFRLFVHRDVVRHYGPEGVKQGCIDTAIAATLALTDAREKGCNCEPFVAIRLVSPGLWCDILHDDWCKLVGPHA